MRNLVLGTLVAVAALTATTKPASAQIRGGVFFGGGPVGGAVVVGGGPRYYPRPYYVAPRPIVVDPWIGPPAYGYYGYPGPVVYGRGRYYGGWGRGHYVGRGRGRW